MLYVPVLFVYRFFIQLLAYKSEADYSYSLCKKDISQLLTCKLEAEKLKMLASFGDSFLFKVTSHKSIESL